MKDGKLSVKVLWPQILSMMRAGFRQNGYSVGTQGSWRLPSMENQFSNLLFRQNAAIAMPSRIPGIRLEDRQTGTNERIAPWSLASHRATCLRIWKRPSQRDLLVGNRNPNRRCHSQPFRGAGQPPAKGAGAVGASVISMGTLLLRPIWKLQTG
ncbi:hypothetical protein VTK56DRAFT_9587 [Thermocarpiscus australiensis]